MKENFPQPLNAQETYLYAQLIRLEALCGMMSSFLEVYAKQNNIATTNNTVKAQIKGDTEPIVEGKKEVVVESKEVKKATPRKKKVVVDES